VFNKNENKSDKISLRDYLSYKIDDFMSKGTVSLISALFFASILIILIASFIITAFNIKPANFSDKMSFYEAFWESLMRTLDPGTMGADEGWAFRFVMLGVTMGGIFIISMLIGIITSGIESKLRELRRGRSRVIEKKHIVILGWSSHIYSMLNELDFLNTGKKKYPIVILAEMDKIEMEDSIKIHAHLKNKTRVICRRGNPDDSDDLNLISLNAADSIVILSPEKDNPDADVIKILLAIIHNKNRKNSPYHIIAEIREQKNEEAIKMIGGSETEVVVVGHFISKIFAQTSRQHGLSIILTDLLDHKGNEIYFRDEPMLHRRTFREILFEFDESSVIGIFKKKKEIMINPRPETMYEANDEIIFITTDIKALKLTKHYKKNIDETSIVHQCTYDVKSKNYLILGWNWKGLNILNYIDKFSSKNSNIFIVANYNEDELKLDTITDEIININIHYIKDDITNKKIFSKIDLSIFENVIILSYSDKFTIQEADSLTILVLLNLRNVINQMGMRLTITSELLDVSNRNIIDIAKSDDFVLSDKLVSYFLVQITRNKFLNDIFAEFFSPEGMEIYLRPAEDYVFLNREINFYTVLFSAFNKGEVAFGYKLEKYAFDSKNNYGIFINPKKSDMITFQKNDKIIVISEN